MRKVYPLLFLLLLLFSNSQNINAQITIPAANTNNGSVNDPLGSYWGYERTALIYRAAEIGLPGPINNVAFFVNSLGSSPGDVVDVRIYLKERPDGMTGTTNYAAEIAGATLVYGPATIPAASLVAGTWAQIDFTTPFNYSGSNNLEVIIETNYGGTGSGEGSTGKQFRYTTQPSSEYYQYWNADNSPPGGLGTRSANRPNIRLGLTLPPCVPGSLNPGSITPPPGGPFCVGASVNLNVTGASFGSGLTYQWEISSDGVNFNPIPGATASSYTANLSATSWFRRVIYCGPGSDVTPAIQLATASMTLPWTENFDALATVGTTSFPSCWTKENGDWRSANNASTGNDADARSLPNFIQDAWSATNEFIWTPGFDLVAGTSYDFSFWYADNPPGYSDWTAEVWTNNIPNSAGASQLGTPFITAGTTAPATYTQVKRSFTPAVSGVYFFAIRVNANFNPWYLSFDDFRLEETPACAAPSGINSTNITATSIDFSWTASISNPADGYEWEVRTSGAPGSGAAGLAASGTTLAGVTNASASGLVANTDYNIYVRSVCSAGSAYSTWDGPVAEHTLCNTINTFPYTETFEDASITRPCWINDQVIGSVGWTYGAGAGNGGNITSAHGGTVNARHFNGSSGSVARLVSPVLDLSGMPPTGAQVRFWFANQDWFGDQNELRVFYRTSSVSPWTLVPGAEYTNSVGQWTEVELILPNSTTSTYQIAFEGIELWGRGAAVDDVTIEVAPTCPKPTQVSAIGVSPTSAMVYFTSPGSAFIVEYGAPGFTPGTDNTAGGGTIVLGASSPITVNGLTAGTTYDFHVRRVCIPGVDYSANVLATASTLCDAVNIPYLQNFETATPPAGFPTCTSMQDVNGNSGPDANVTGGRWTTFAGTSGDTYVSPTNVLRYLYDLPVPTRPADDWFFIQGLNLNAGTNYRLKFFYKASDGPTWTERLEVKYGTAAYAGAMTNTLYTNNNINTAIASPWDSAIVEFSPAASGVYYIGFHAMSLADQAFLYIDDISVRVAPVVDVGITGIITPDLTCPVNGVFLQATIRNYNTNPINFSQYPVTINANFTGASTGTATTTLTTGTLAPGASMTVYLDPAHNFGPGSHNVTVTTVSPEDPETSNDAFTTTINVSPNPATPVITPAVAAVCSGSTVMLSTQFTTPPAPPVTLPAVSSGAITLSIPDGNAAGTTTSLNVTGVPAGATITGISVSLNLTHTWISDMVINLKAPNGNILNLFDSKGGNGDNLVNTVISSTGTTGLGAGTPPFTGTFAADASNGVGPTGNASNVTNWAGLYSVANGTWTLALRDQFLFDNGTLTSWSITISYQFLNPVVTWTPNTSLFTNSGATNPYDGTSNAPVIYAQPGSTTTYTATATNSAGCTASRTVNVNVSEFPEVTIGNLPDTVCTSDPMFQLPATPAGGVWSGIGVSGNNFVPASTAVGTYMLSYSYTSPAGCTTTETTQIAVKDCPERIIRLIDNAVMIYPNPNNGQFNVHINSTLYSYLTMRVYSNDGRLVHTRQLSGLTYGRVIPIDLTHLSGGTYMVQFYYDGGVRTSEKTFKMVIGH